jgi:hypothetical protein
MPKAEPKPELKKNTDKPGVAPAGFAEPKIAKPDPEPEKIPVPSTPAPLPEKKLDATPNGSVRPPKLEAAPKPAEPMVPKIETPKPKSDLPGIDVPKIEPATPKLVEPKGLEIPAFPGVGGTPSLPPIEPATPKLVEPKGLDIPAVPGVGGIPSLPPIEPVTPKKGSSQSYSSPLNQPQRLTIESIPGVARPRAESVFYNHTDKDVVFVVDGSRVTVPAKHRISVESNREITLTVGDETTRTVSIPAGVLGLEIRWKDVSGR